MKNLYPILIAIPLFIGCGDGNNSSIKNKGANKGSKKKIICIGDKCSAPACKDIEGLLVTEKNGNLNRREIPRGYKGIVKTCYPNGKVKSMVGWASNWKNGEEYLYREDGSLEFHQVYKAQKGRTISSMSSSITYRPDGTCMGKGFWLNNQFHGEQIQCNEKGEVISKAVWEKGKLISCQGKACL